MNSERDLTSRLVADSIDWTHGSAYLRGVSIEEVAATCGTPFYLYDEEKIAHQYCTLRHALPGAIDIFYSVKANPHPRVIQILTELGAGCEIASGGEYAIVRKAGAAPERIVFAGPGKGNDELEYVIRRGVAEIHAESFEELEALESLAERLRTTVRVSIRVNPRLALAGGLLMGGQPTVFGLEEESLDKVAQVICQCRHLTLCGVHVYTGTQILDAEALVKHWVHALEIAKELSQLAGVPLQTVNLGGGLGIPYFAREYELDLTVLRRGAEDLLESAVGDPGLSTCRFVVEPGRFLVGPAGVYVARVRSVKTCRGTSFVVLDGGMNHHLAASGNLGQVIRRDYPILNLSRSVPSNGRAVVVVGPLCTPIDTLGRNVTMSDPRPGDLIGILQSGAYGLTASPVHFLRHPTPAEVLVTHRKYELITPRGVVWD